MAVRGRPFEPGNKFGRGRPPGSRNKKTVLAQALLNSHAEHIAAKVVAQALQGDRTALRLAVDRVLPVRREPHVFLGPIRTKTAAQLSESLGVIIQKVTEGQLTIAEGQGMADLLEKRRRAIETEDIDQRLRALEGRQ